MIITIAREHGSGGQQIAKAVAKQLNIPLYDKEVITRAAKESGLTEEAIAASEKQRSGSLLYSLYTMGNTMPLADQVYILESNIIKEVAAQGDCVVLGRCGDYVLREMSNIVRVFLYAPLENRIRRVRSSADMANITDKELEALIAKKDRSRAGYYNYYTENRWGEAKNYDLCLNTAIGDDVCAAIIIQASHAMEAAKQHE